MSAISNAVFLSKIKEIQTEIRKLDADMERRSEKLAQAFMQYKEGELSKEAYIEMKDDRNNWKAVLRREKENSGADHTKAGKTAERRSQIFTKSAGTGWDNQNQCGTCGELD